MLISGVPKVTPSRGDQQVAAQRQPEAAGEHVAVGRAERGLAEPRHQPEELEEEVVGEVLVDQRRVGGEAAEVGARAEHLLAGAGQHHRPDRIVVADPLDGVDELAEQLGESALRCSGRFRVSVATPSETS